MAEAHHLTQGLTGKLFRKNLFSGVLVRLTHFRTHQLMSIHIHLVTSSIPLHPDEYQSIRQYLNLSSGRGAEKRARRNVTWHRRALKLLQGSWLLFRDHSCILRNACLKEFLGKSPAYLNYSAFFFFFHILGKKGYSIG